MPEGFNELPKSDLEQVPIRMTHEQLMSISGNNFASPEKLALIAQLGITIDEGNERKVQKVSIGGEVKYMCVNRSDFGTLQDL